MHKGPPVIDGSLIRMLALCGRNTSFRTVARLLNTHQSTVTRQMDKLEAQLGFRVVHRSPEGFATTDEAINTLYASTSRSRRSRLRAIAHVAEELDGQLGAPETWSQQKLLRLSAAMRAGYTDVITETLRAQTEHGPRTDWQAILPYINEAEAELRSSEPSDPRPGRPRRVMHLRQGLTVRREQSRQGYILRFSGREATGEFIETVLDEIERWLAVE